MVAFAYVIPIIACLLLHFEFGFYGKWTAYMWIMLFGEATAGLIHWLFYCIHTSKKEYLGSYVVSIHYEEPWTELKEVTETKTDRNGRSYTVTRIKEEYHKEKYFFINSRGSNIQCDCRFYNYVSGIWRLPPQCVSWSGRNIKGGKRYGTENYFSELDAQEQSTPKYWVPITETSTYTNKVCSSNSIFKFEKIDPKQAAEMGLYDYPAISDFDAPCILSRDIQVGEEVRSLFNKFNAYYAPQWQMRLYILLFDAHKGISISEKQRAYWQGGNKNEFIICLGMTDDNTIGWARAFSWADQQDYEVKISQWLMHNPTLDWQKLYGYLQIALCGWKRKEFKDFDYINITLPLWQIVTILILTAAENAFAIYLAIK